VRSRELAREGQEKGDKPLQGEKKSTPERREREKKTNVKLYYEKISGEVWLGSIRGCGTGSRGEREA